MSRRPRMFGTVAALVGAIALSLAACAPSGVPSTSPPSPTPSAPTGPVPHRVGIVDGAFVDHDAGDAAFVPRGVNYFRIVRGADRVFAVGVYDHVRVDRDFARLADAGYTTVRMFMDSCDDGPECIAESGIPGLNAAYLGNIADATRLARDHGLVLLLTSNDIPDGGGFRRGYETLDPAVFPGYRNTDFLAAPGHAAMAAYWDALLTGLADQGAAFDAVLGWSLLNEEWVFREQPPLTLTSGLVTTASGTYDMADADAHRTMVDESVRALIATVAPVVRAHDPDGLVTMGFFVPQFPNATDAGGTWFVDTAPLVASSDLDFFDFHAYPGWGLGATEIGENFGIDDEKPVIMGEVGAFLSLYPTVEGAGLSIQNWVAESCGAGFDGWLYWGYDRSPLDDGTWGLTDADGYLLDALSPAAWPDPCTPTLVDPNLAIGANVAASAEAPDRPAVYAVDGDPSTTWSSDADAPQWIEVDVGGATVTTVRLTVAQYPAGRTVHVVTVTDAGGAREVYRFAGETNDGDVLEATFPTPIPGVRSVRVTTIESPSWVAWREIAIE